MIDHILTII